MPFFHNDSTRYCYVSKNSSDCDAFSSTRATLPSNRHQRWKSAMARVKSSASSNFVNLFPPQNTAFFPAVGRKIKNPTAGLVRLFRQPCRAIAMPFGSQYAPFPGRPFANCAAENSTVRFEEGYNSLEDNAVTPATFSGTPQAG
jgi:hypothetical protein